MKISLDVSGQALIEFENLDELRAEYETNISAGGLCLVTEVEVAEFTTLQLTLKLTGGGQLTVPAIVVRRLPGALAVSIETKPETIFEALTTKPANTEAGTEKGTEKDQNVWDRLRSLSRTEKVMLAAKADRTERAVLAQENDAQVLFYLLKNPRINLEEVVRIARSPLLSYNIAELIAKTSQWASSPEIRIALVNNPRTPTQLALKLLPTLPEPE
ncbi:MAG: PilZ domain-containing protein, partial [Acidobacteriota bacterium]